MKRFTDAVSGREYMLAPDPRRKLTGYYYSAEPQETVLYCAESGRWFAWIPSAQTWQRAQEWCRRYDEAREAFQRILPPAGLPLPDEAEKAEALKLEEKLRVWEEQREKDWLEEEIERCDRRDVTVHRDGSCSICAGWTLDEPLGIVTEVLELDAENTNRLLSIIVQSPEDGDGAPWGRSWPTDFWRQIEPHLEDGENLESFLRRHGIDYHFSSV